MKKDRLSFTTKKFRIVVSVVTGALLALLASMITPAIGKIHPLQIDESWFNAQSHLRIESVTQGVNSIKIVGWCAIPGVGGEETENRVFVTPGDDPLTAYPLETYAATSVDANDFFANPAVDYSMCGFAATLTAGQVPDGMYAIAVHTSGDGQDAWYPTQYTVAPNQYLQASAAVFYLLAFALYAVCVWLLLTCASAASRSSVEPCPLPGAQGRLRAALSIVFLGVFFWLFLNVAFAPVGAFAGGEIYRPLFVAWSACLLLTFMLALYLGAPCRKWLKKNRYLLLAAGLAGLFVFQLCVLASTRGILRGTDSWHIAQSAQTLAGQGTVTYWPEYFIWYPHNLFMLFTDAAVWQAAAAAGVSFDWLSRVLNALLLDGTIFLTFLCVERLAGLRAAGAALVPLVLLVGLNPMMNMFYTDILSMIFVALILYFYLRLKDARLPGIRAVWLAALCAAAAVGCLYKMTVIILPVALFIVELAVNIRHIRRVACALGAGALLLACVLGGGALVDSYVEKAGVLRIVDRQATEAEALPVWHWVMIGLRQPYGQVSEEDFGFSVSLPRATREEEIKREILQRLDAMRPGEYLAFLNNKALYTLGDATFSSGASAITAELEMPANDFFRGLQQVFGATGKWYPLFAYTLQGVWIACLFLIILPLFGRGRFRPTDTVAALRLSLLGFLAYILISEANTRQVVNQLPIFLTQINFHQQPSK